MRQIKTISLQLRDNKSDKTIIYPLTPMQCYAVEKILGLDFDTSTDKVEYFTDQSLENIIGSDMFLKNLTISKNHKNIHKKDKKDKNKDNED